MRFGVLHYVRESLSPCAVPVIFVPKKVPMVGRSLQQDKDPYRPKEEGEEVLGPECPYLSAIGALMYLANCTRPDIAFTVNLLARYSAEPIKGIGRE